MNPLNQEYDLTGYLTEDFRHIELDNPKMVKLIARKLAGVPLDVRIKPFKEKRSDSQNRYFWAVIIPYVQTWLREVKGEAHKPDEVYAWIRLSLLGSNVKVVTVLGQEVIMVEDKHFSKMTTKEFAETVDTIRAKMLERGCDIPEPTKNNTLSEHYERLTDD